MLRLSDKVISGFVAIAMVLTMVPVPSIQGAPVNSMSYIDFHQRLKQEDIRLPSHWGMIEEIHLGKSDDVVVLIQDAHAIPDAQKNIQKIIKHFQSSYDVHLVALEGAATELDPQFLRSFPDRDYLRLVLKEYHQRGELPGGATAALVNSEGSIYHGIEDWSLYEEGLRYYLKAIEDESELLKKIQVQKDRLQLEKKRVYSSDLIKIDELVQSFYHNHTQLPELLDLLAMYKEPRRDTELAVIYKEMKISESQETDIAQEMKQIIKKVGSYLADHSHRSKKIAEDLMTYNRYLQNYQISKITARDFSLFLTQLAAKYRIPIKFSFEMKESVRHQKKVSGIRGTELFMELKDHVAQVKKQLFLSDHERALDKRTHEIYLLEQLTKLELTQDEWQALQKLDTTQYDSQDYRYHFAFYENAKARDSVFYRNLKLLHQKYEQKSSLLVAGGFHTEGLKALFKENGTSYLLVMPAVKHFPKKNNYRKHMRGEVSWKDYLRVEKGKVSNANAFLRRTRDQLLLNSGNRPSLLKTWRDQIIRDLARKNRIEKASKYTMYLDEVVLGDLGKKRQESISDSIQDFVSGIRQLHASGELTQRNVMNLFKPATAVPVLTGPNILGKELVEPGITKGESGIQDASLGLAASETRIVPAIRDNLASFLQTVNSLSAYDQENQDPGGDLAVLETVWQLDRSYVDAISPFYDATDSTVESMRLQLKQDSDTQSESIPLEDGILRPRASVFVGNGIENFAQHVSQKGKNAAGFVAFGQSQVRGEPVYLYIIADNGPGFRDSDEQSVSILEAVQQHRKFGDGQNFGTALTTLALQPNVLLTITGTERALFDKRSVSQRIGPNLHIQHAEHVQDQAPIQGTVHIGAFFNFDPSREDLRDQIYGDVLATLSEVAQMPIAQSETRLNVKYGAAMRKVRTKGHDVVIQKRIDIRDDVSEHGLGSLVGVGDGFYGDYASKEVASQLEKGTIFENQIIQADGNIVLALARTFVILNDIVLRGLQRVPDGDPTPGTTVSLAYITENNLKQRKAFIAVIGDSPVIVIDKQGRIKFISPRHGYANNLEKSIGGDLDVYEPGDEIPEIFEIDLEEGDQLIALTDGAQYYDDHEVVKNEDRNKEFVIQPQTQKRYWGNPTDLHELEDSYVAYSEAELFAPREANRLYREQTQNQEPRRTAEKVIRIGPRGDDSSVVVANIKEDEPDVASSETRSLAEAGKVGAYPDRFREAYKSWREGEMSHISLQSNSPSGYKFLPGDNSKGPGTLQEFERLKEAIVILYPDAPISTRTEEKIDEIARTEKKDGERDAPNPFEVTNDELMEMLEILETLNVTGEGPILTDYDKRDLMEAYLELDKVNRLGTDDSSSLFARRTHTFNTVRRLIVDIARIRLPQPESEYVEDLDENFELRRSKTFHFSYQNGFSEEERLEIHLKYKGAEDTQPDAFFKQNPQLMLKPFELIATNPEIEISHALRKGLIKNSGDFKFWVDGKRKSSPEVLHPLHQSFVQLLKSSKPIASRLWEMHRLGLLAAYLPEIAGIHHLVADARFHQYSVDQHSIYNLQVLEDINDNRGAYAFNQIVETGSYDEIMNNPEDILALRLALLFHDTGKDEYFDGAADHAIRGAQQLSPERLEELRTAVPEVSNVVLPVAWIIRNHMLLNMTIINRELHRFPEQQIDVVETLVEDNQIDPKMLDMIYLVSLTDYMSTRPTDYKFQHGYFPISRWGGMIPSYLDHFGALHSIHAQTSDILKTPVENRPAKLDEIKKKTRNLREENERVYVTAKQNEIQRMITRDDGAEFERLLQGYFDAIPDGPVYEKVKTREIQEAVSDVFLSSLSDLMDEYQRIFPYSYLMSLSRKLDEHIRRILFLAHLRVLKNPPGGGEAIRTPILLFYKDYDRFYEQHYEVIVGIADDQIGEISRVTGVLWANGIDVHGADLHTEADGTVVDRFFGFRESQDVLIEETQSHIWRDLLEVADPGSAVSLVTVFKRRNQDYLSKRGRFAEYVETEVKFRDEDEELNGHPVSVLDVVHEDQRGLLHVITTGLASRGIDIERLPARTYSPVAQNSIYVHVDKKALTDQQKNDIERFISELLAKDEIDVAEIRSETRAQFELEWPQSEKLSFQYEFYPDHPSAGLNWQHIHPDLVQEAFLKMFESFPGYWTFLQSIRTVTDSAPYLERGFGTPDPSFGLDNRFKIRLSLDSNGETIKYEIYDAQELKLEANLEAEDSVIQLDPITPLAEGTIDVIETPDPRLQIRLENQRFEAAQLSKVQLDFWIQSPEHEFWEGETEAPKRYVKFKKILRRFFIDKQYTSDEVLIGFLADIANLGNQPKPPKYFEFRPRYVIRFVYAVDQGKWAFSINHRPDGESVDISNPIVTGSLSLLKTTDDTAQSETRNPDRDEDVAHPVNPLVVLDSVESLAEQIKAINGGRVYKVLILEDNPDHLGSYANQVIMPLQDEQYDFEYQFEVDGFTGLEIYEAALKTHEPFDLVISDREMPAGAGDDDDRTSVATGEFFIHRVSQVRGQSVMRRPVPIIINSTVTPTNNLMNYDNVVLYVGKHLISHQIGDETYNAFGLVREILKGVFDKIPEDQQLKSETRLNTRVNQASTHYVGWFRAKNGNGSQRHIEEVSRLVLIRDPSALNAFLDDFEKRVIEQYESETSNYVQQHGRKALDIVSRLKQFIQTRFLDKKAVMGLAAEKGKEVHYLDAVRDLNGAIGELFVHGHVDKEFLAEMTEEGIIARPNNSLSTFDDPDQGFVPLIEAQNVEQVTRLSKVLRIGLQSDNYDQSDSIAFYDYSVAVLMEFALGIVAVDKLSVEDVEWLNQIADIEDLSEADQKRLNQIQGELLGEIRKVLGFNLKSSLNLKGGELQLFMTQIHQLVTEHEVSLQIRQSA